MKSNTVYVLSRDPLVVAGGFSTLEQLSTTKAAFTFLYHNVGWLRPHGLPRYLRAKRMCGNDRKLIVITNEPSEARWLRLVGIQAYALSHNIHVREEFFSPVVSCHKAFDAVYSAQLASFKRLALARAVPRLSVVTYENGKREWDLHAFEPSLSHASFNKAWMPPEAVRDVYRGSYAALALSAKEGAMFACMEYLMCGLPVVTTRNRGGRNRYLTPFNSRFVSPRPEAVARAVAEFVAAPPDPLAIRAEVLALVRRDRLAYLDILRRNCRVPIHSLEAELDRLWGGEDGIEKHAVPVSAFIASVA
jgi:glycosyltransferase involved in cell wall biosynthesis